MRHLLINILLVIAVSFQYSLAKDSTNVPKLLAIDIQAKNNDDIIFTKAASGLVIGTPIDESILQTSMAAIRLTDRFKTVTGQLLPKSDGVIASIKVDAWPAIKDIKWLGDAQTKMAKKLIHGLRPGMHLGDDRLAAWSLELKNKFIESGYPEAKVFWTRAQDDQLLNITIILGAANIIKNIEVVGNINPYTIEQIKKITKLVPEHSIWNAVTQQMVIKNLKAVLQSHQRYEAYIDLQWKDNSKSLHININTGPKITLVFKGIGVSWSESIKNLIPLNYINYSSDVLDEGDRRILSYFQNQGYLNAKVQHSRKITDTNTDKGNYNNQKVVITYNINKGKQSHLNNLYFNGNNSFTNKEIQKAINISAHQIARGSLQVSPNLLNGLESKIKSFYLRHGYTSVTLRRRLEYKDGDTNLTFKIQEGPKHLLQWLKLELHSNKLNNPWIVGESLSLIFNSQVIPKLRQDTTRTYHSNRQNLKNVYGTLSLLTNNRFDNYSIFIFQFNKPIPLIKIDLARVITHLKEQCLPALGFFQPTVQLSLEPSVDGNFGAYIKVPAQPDKTIRRLVVSGADKTRAKTIFGTMPLDSNQPISSSQINSIQASINHLNSFHRADLQSLAVNNELALISAKESPLKWQDGDLKLILEEQAPYVVTGSFSYDKNQDCQFDLGLTQINVNGMGRTIDYGIGIRNGIIKGYRISPLIIAYTDPLIATPLLKSLLPDQAKYRAELAYIEDETLHLMHRLRLLNSLNWSLSPTVMFKLGHRWEHATISKKSNCTYNHNIISSPFVQLTRDTRNNYLDPTNGMYSMVQLECANQLLFTSRQNSFIKLDIKNQWNWPVGYEAKNGVVTLGLRLGLTKLTSNKKSKKIPFSERFFAGGPFSLRGVEPNALGPIQKQPSPQKDDDCFSTVNSTADYTPIGGDGLILVNLEYRFPLVNKSIWGEVFIDSGQVYMHSLPTSNHRPRTTAGCGLILKLGIPIKLEYAADIKRILNKRRSKDEKSTQCKSLLVSVGFQF